MGIAISNKIIFLFPLFSNIPWFNCAVGWRGARNYAPMESCQT